MSRKRKNYLNKHSIMEEIHKSKCSYCEFVDDKYKDYDVIVENFSEIFKEQTTEKALANRKKRLLRSKSKEEISKDDLNINKNPIVYRLITYDHIPYDLHRKKSKKQVKDYHVKINFTPFKHYIFKHLNGRDRLVEVGRSHSKNGKFSATHGQYTDTLVNMFIMLTERYGRLPGWRNYTYLDDMKLQSLMQLVDVGLLFNEHKTDNPFGYYTRILERSFTKIFHIEKKHQKIRDDLLEESNLTPSFTRQLENDKAMKGDYIYDEDNNDDQE